MMKNSLLNTLLTIGLITINCIEAYASDDDFAALATGQSIITSAAAKVMVNNTSDIVEYNQGLSNIGITVEEYVTEKQAGQTIAQIEVAGVLALYGGSITAANPAPAGHQLSNADITTGINMALTKGLTLADLNNTDVLGFAAGARLGIIETAANGTVTEANFDKYVAALRYIYDPTGTGTFAAPLNAADDRRINTIEATSNLIEDKSADNFNSAPWIAIAPGLALAAEAVAVAQITDNITRVNTTSGKTLSWAIRNGWGTLLNTDHAVPNYMAEATSARNSYNGVNSGLTQFRLIWKNTNVPAYPNNANGNQMAVGDLFTVAEADITASIQTTLNKIAVGDFIVFNNTQTGQAGTNVGFVKASSPKDFQ